MTTDEIDKKVALIVDNTYRHAFRIGQANPSDEIIIKIITLSRQYSIERLMNGNISQIDNERLLYIKQHWNDE